MAVCSRSLPGVEYEDIISEQGILNKDIKTKRAVKIGIKFLPGDVLFGKLRPYLKNWLLPDFTGVAVGDFWVLQPSEIDSQYLYYLIQTPAFQEVSNQSTGTKMPRADWNLVANSMFFLPQNDDEQTCIGTFFRQLDRLITLHQCNCNMATRPCEWSSGLRAIAWEQRKFSDLVQIERGGSPRPIEKYITDEPNGLNWIKIGDAPLQGNYITKTDEKIKPSGLSKTRQVHPGDLILSNSMSFGRPYILAISGCIHDGWLLIRDVQNKFDLKFLCYLLGTDQMLDQYKALASGSTVNNLNKDLVGNTQITIPDITEQKVLGEYFDLLDRLITLHQRKHILLT